MEEIKGYVEHIVYRNEDNGSTVFNLNNDDGDLTCVGKFHYIEEGELLELTGEYIVHKVYLSAKIWHFYDTGGKDLSALWSERLSRNRRKSISDGRSCAGSWL